MFGLVYVGLCVLGLFISLSLLFGYLGLGLGGWVWVLGWVFEVDFGVVFLGGLFFGG